MTLTPTPTHPIAQVVKPKMIGVHGPALSTVNPSSCAIFESHGAPVEPRSLYLRQLELRLDGIPAWWATGRVGLGVGLGQW